jgi:cytochrome c oxidase cbb3-type subunit 3
MAFLYLAGIAFLFVASMQAQQSDDDKAGPNGKSRPGQRTFTATCSACHGLDGRGGERAPNITGSAKLQHLSDTELASIVSNGIPAAGMPAFRSLGVSEVHAVVSYLRVLQGKKKSVALPGNPASGKDLFAGKAGCSSCHMVGGEGGFLGPDLSLYAATRSAPEVVDAITNPGKNAAVSQKSVVAVTRDDHRISGLVRNEDNFSIQILTAEGVYHFLSRTDLTSLEYHDPIMPFDYRDRLTGGELNDLASYLIGVGRAAKPVLATRDNN